MNIRDPAHLLPQALSRGVGPGACRLGEILCRLREEGARPLLVGGWVRDALLGRDSTDIDVEVFGIAADRLERIVGSLVPLVLVGKAFAVYKVEPNVEFSLPRKDSLVGTGHRGFAVEAIPDLPFPEAAQRRDFTMNAMALDPFTGELLDPWGGRDDLEANLLEIVDRDRFADDPLRVLRAAQFLARFPLSPSSSLIEASRRVGAETLPAERVFAELCKLLRGERPSRGLRFLLASGWIRYLPEVAALVGVPQDPSWHPEGDVWTHVLRSLDEAVALRPGEERRDLLLMLGVLCHDLGKATMTRCIAGRIRSIGHSEAGAALATRFLTRLTKDRTIIAGVEELVRWHLAPEFLSTQSAKLSAVRRLARRLAPEADIVILERCSRADYRGSGRREDEAFPAGEWLLRAASDAGVLDRPEEPVLQGRHLLERGVPPGPSMGALLRRAYLIQIDEGIRDVAHLAERVMREPDGPESSDGELDASRIERAVER